MIVKPVHFVSPRQHRLLKVQAERKEMEDKLKQMSGSEEKDSLLQVMPTHVS